MRFSAASGAVTRTCRDVVRNETFQAAAALSYYCILGVFPGLILLSAVLGYMPLPDLFGAVLALMQHILPVDTMRMIYSVLADVLSADRRTWLSLGMLGTLWVMSSAFDAMIEALNTAYGVTDDRPFWKTRLLAVSLAAVTGVLLLCALAVMIVGPRFGEWLAGKIYVSGLFIWLWPFLHWTIAIIFSVFAVEVLYFLAPNVKQRFLATLPGAVLAVTFWIGLSYLLGLYFRHFADYNRTYGTLGGFVAFMTWFYWTSFFFIAGAELNAELAKVTQPGPLKRKRKDSPSGENLDRVA
jgi:membrane protein